MKINIRCQGLGLNDEERDHFERRLGFALGRFAPRVQSVSALVRDTNADRGGVDKRCRLMARVTGVGDLVIEDDDANLLAVIDRATERLGRLVARRLERQRFTRDRVAYDGGGTVSARLATAKWADD